MILKNIKQGEYITEEQFEQIKEHFLESYSDPYFEPKLGEYTNNEDDILHKIIFKNYDEDGDVMDSLEIVIIEINGNDSNQQYFVDYKE